jgi:predicted kinase
MTRPLDVLVIRGAPGAGKSTLGRGLRRALANGAVLEVDDFRGMLSQVDWSSRAHHDVALDAALAAITAYLAHGRRPVVLIDTFSRSRLTSVQQRLGGADLHHHTLSLWIDPDVLAVRLEARTSGFKEWEPSRVLNDEVRTNRYPAEHFVDATSLDREAIVELALAVVANHDEEGAA